MKKTPEWLRWLHLAMVFFIPFGAWMDFRDYQEYYAAGVFSPEQWAEVMEGLRFHWAVLGLMTLCFLINFIFMTWNKNGDKDITLADKLIGTGLLLVCAALPLTVPVPSGARALWATVLIVLVVVVGRGWVTYYENKRLEEEYYE